MIQSYRDAGDCDGAVRVGEVGRSRLGIDSRLACPGGRGWSVATSALEHFPAKWEPVRRRKCDQTENLARLLAPRLQPAPEVQGAQGLLVLGRLLEGAVVELADPDLIGGARAVLGEREPHQPARGLARNVVAGKQHGPEHGLRRALPLLRRP